MFSDKRCTFPRVFLVKKKALGVVTIAIFREEQSLVLAICHEVYVGLLSRAGVRFPANEMSKQIDVTVPDSETLSSEKSKRFTVSSELVLSSISKLLLPTSLLVFFCPLFAPDHSQIKTNRYAWIISQ